MTSKLGMNLSKDECDNTENCMDQNQNLAGATLGCLDYSRANELINDEETIAEMLLMLMDSLKVDLPFIRSAAIEADWLQLDSTLHRLKGVMALFCDNDTARLLQELEPQFKASKLAGNKAPSKLDIENLNQLLSRLTSFELSANNWLQNRKKSL
jgi:HPt (histidine-containing phosphotransfer) domain-containing protein